jgi:hypothetical protein
MRLEAAPILLYIKVSLYQSSCLKITKEPAMKTVIFIFALFIVNMMLSTYAFTDDSAKANQDPVAASFL